MLPTRGEENCTLQGYYAARSGSFLRTFRDSQGAVAMTNVPRQCGQDICT